MTDPKSQLTTDVMNDFSVLPGEDATFVVIGALWMF